VRYCRYVKVLHQISPTTLWIVTGKSVGYLDLKGEKNRPNTHDALRAFACVIDYMFFCDENTTVNGVVIIADLGHYLLKMETGYLSLEDRRDFTQTWQVWSNITYVQRRRWWWRWWCIQASKFLRQNKSFCKKRAIKKTSFSMPPSGQIGRQRRCVLNLHRPLLNFWTRYFKNERSNWHSFDHKSSTGQGHETVNFGGQEVKGQGHSDEDLTAACGVSAWRLQRPERRHRERNHRL